TSRGSWPGVGRRTEPRIRPRSSTTPAATFVPPTSTPIASPAPAAPGAEPEVASKPVELLTDVDPLYPVAVRPGSIRGVSFGGRPRRGPGGVGAAGKVGGRPGGPGGGRQRGGGVEQMAHDVGPAAGDRGEQAAQRAAGAQRRSGRHRPGRTVEGVGGWFVAGPFLAGRTGRTGRVGGPAVGAEPLPDGRRQQRRLLCQRAGLRRDAPVLRWGPLVLRRDTSVGHARTHWSGSGTNETTSRSSRSHAPRTSQRRSAAGSASSRRCGPTVTTSSSPIRARSTSPRSANGTPNDSA